MACLDSCSLIVVSSSFILCFALFYSELPGRFRFNSSSSVVRDILSVKVCVWWNQSFVYLSSLCFLFVCFIDECVSVDVAAIIGGKIRSEAAWKYCFLYWGFLWWFPKGGVLTGKWVRVWRREIMTKCMWVYVYLCVSTGFCSRFCSVKRWFGFSSFFLHQQIYFIVFLSFTFKI